MDEIDKLKAENKYLKAENKALRDLVLKSQALVCDLRKALVIIQQSNYDIKKYERDLEDNCGIIYNDEETHQV
jgi:hypothetical protein